MTLRIGVDVDGVLADFRSAFHATAKRVLRRDIEFSTSPQSDGQLGPSEIRRVWEHIAKAQNWWMEVEPYEPEQIARFYGLAREASWEVFFLTRRPASAGDSVQFQTQWWIERFGFYLPAVLTVPGSRGDVANGLRLDLLLDDQLINCVEVVSSTPTKALLMLRGEDDATRNHAKDRGIGVVSTLSEAITIIERLNDVLPQRRGRLLRLADWFTGRSEVQALPQNPRAVRPVPPFKKP